jgi:hypothetical protein
MTLPASPPITMAQVRAEFGGTAGVTKLSAYVRSGALVPNYPANSGVPTSVPIKLSDLCGASNTPPYSASAAPTTVTGSRTTPGIATSSNCTCTVTGGGGTKTYNWTRVSGDTTTTAGSPSLATTNFRASCTVSGVHKISVWHCTVTDTVSGVTTTNPATADVDYTL